MRIDCIHLAGLDQRGDDGPVFGTGIVTGEEGVLAVQGDGADGALDGVAVDLDAAFGQEAAEAVAVFGDVGESLAEGRFRRDTSPVVQQPIIEAGKDGGGTLLPCGKARGGVAAPDVGLSGIEIVG